MRWLFCFNIYCNSGSAYVFKYNGINWIEQTKLQLPDGQCLNQFGWDVDVYENKIIIGSPDGHWNITNGHGNAYLFEFNGLRWILKAKLYSDNVEYGDHFGWSVAISDNAALVGSELSDISGIDSGTAYIFDTNITAGDFNCDGNIDVYDLSIIASAWLSEYGHKINYKIL